MLDTKIKGSPGSLHQLADWFRDVLAAEIHESVTSAYRARTNTETDWTGPAGDSFRQRMTTAGGKADDVCADAKAGSSLAEQVATNLTTSKRRMDEVRAEAAKAGLTVTADGILPPGSAPAEPSPRATPQQERTYSAAVTLHRNQLAAYAKAQKDVAAIRKDMSFFEMSKKNMIDDLVGKAPFQAASFANDTYIAHAMAKRASRLGMARRSIMTRARDFSRTQPTGNIGTQDYRGQREHLRTKQGYGKLAQKAGGKALRASRTAPVIGMVIAGGVLAWDLEHGKPPTKAISSAVVSTAAGMGAGSLIGGAVGGTFGNVPGAIAGGVGGMLVGAGVGAVYDTGWDKLHMQDKGWVKWTDKKLTSGWHKVF